MEVANLLKRTKNLFVTILVMLSVIAPVSLVKAGEKAGLADEQMRAIAALPVVPPGLNGDARMVSGPPGKVRATLVYRVHCDALKAHEWVFFSALPPELPGQSLLKFEPSPEARRIHDASALARPLLETRIAGNPDHSDQAEVRLVMDLTLHSRKLELRPTAAILSKPVEPLTPEERALALRFDGLVDYRGDDLADWMAKHRLQRRTGEGEVEFASRVFLRIVEEIDYHYVAEHQDRSADGVCVAGRSDCGGMSVLFTAILRSQGIPARLRVGRWAESAREGERVDQMDYHQEHVKAEFYAQGAGWIPVDPSSAVLHDRTPGKLQFFGNDTGDFITLHVDTDIIVDTIHFGLKTHSFLQLPAFWVTGQGNLDDVQIHQSWVVESLPDDSRD